MFRPGANTGLAPDIKPSLECWLLHEYGDGSICLFLSRLRGEGW